ncbi:MAG: tricarballylate utilization 4Fe-4S protein TcuB [Hyphomicrobiales bacterium]
MPATDETHASEDLAEAARLMTVCNSCRYCEGLCAVFPAMEMRRAFADADLNYLANLCHNCGACYDDCQFAPPHEFDVDVPRTLAKLRAKSYETHAWPQALSGMYTRNGLKVGIVSVLGVALFVLGFSAANDPAALFGRHQGQGAFYELMPHGAMALLFGAAFLYAVLALAKSVGGFWRDTGSATPMRLAAGSLWQALEDVCRLRYLEGGGVGCMNEEDRPTDRRALYHHLAFYGFLLCFAATCVATLEHYLLGREAPYPWYDLPVLLGTIGGIGLLIGPAGLLVAKWKRDPVLADAERFGMDAAFIATLFMTSLTGLALLAWRDSPAMGPLLALHLGVVLALFLTMPYGKFVHGIYRFAALVRYAQERRGLGKASGEGEA